MPRALRSLAGRLGSPLGSPHADSHFLESRPPQEQELGLASNRWTQWRWWDDVTVFNTATRMEVWSRTHVHATQCGKDLLAERLCPPSDLEEKLPCLWASKEGGGPRGKGHRAASRGQPAGTETLGPVAAKLWNLPQITESLNARLFPCPTSDDTAACLLLHQTQTHSYSWPTLVCGFKLLLSHSVMSEGHDSMESSPPGSSVHGISQARILEWVAISVSRVQAVKFMQ